jgi:peptidoglycan/LPS O-acetylase OafA/YrhL
LKIESLQILRAIAAWLVVYHHYIQKFYGFNSDSIFNSFFSYRGGFGVDIFFVLSGFVMYITATRPSTGGWSFFIKRLFRVLPAYWFFSLLLIFLVSMIPEQFPNNQYTLETLIYSMLFIPHENPSGLGVYPFLTVGWTLNYEVLFYSILAMCIFLNKKNAIYICSSVILIAPLLFINESHTLLSVIKSPLMWQFVFGVAVAWLYQRFNIIKDFNPVFGIVSILISVVLLTGVLGYGVVHKTIAATLILFGFILINDSINFNSIFVRFLMRLGDYSYSTYLCHILVIGLMLKLFGNDLSVITEVLVLIILSALIYFTSKVSYKLIENSQLIGTVRDKLISRGL